MSTQVYFFHQFFFICCLLRNEAAAQGCVLEIFLYFSSLAGFILGLYGKFPKDAGSLDKMNHSKPHTYSLFHVPIILEYDDSGTVYTTPSCPIENISNCRPFFWTPSSWTTTHCKPTSHINYGNSNPTTPKTKLFSISSITFSWRWSHSSSGRNNGSHPLTLSSLLLKLYSSPKCILQSVNIHMQLHLMASRNPIQILTHHLPSESWQELW